MSTELEMKIRILVLDRGFIGVCRCPDPKGSAFWIEVKDWRTIRNWGTTNGLEELVKGPTSLTTMDALAPQSDIPTRAIIRTFLVEQDKWESSLNGNTKKRQRGS